MKIAIRQLLKNPGFTIVAMVTLALGIGVNTTAFSALNSLLLHKVPFPDIGRMVQVWSSTPSRERARQSPGDYVDECDQNTVFDNMAAYSLGMQTSLAEPGQAPAQCVAMHVTASFFPLFGIRAQMGRTPTEAEDRHLDKVAVVSDAFWREHYGSDPKILGRSAMLNSKVYTIVGVLAPYLDDPAYFGGQPAFWVLDGLREITDFRGAGWYIVSARLKPGVTMDQAQVEMTRIGAKLAHDFPKTNKDRTLKVTPYPTGTVGYTTTKLTWLVMALCCAVLLIACVNLANLQLVRTARRSQELAVRMALGCSRSRLVSMLLVESVLLSLGGGALGLLVAFWGNAFVTQFIRRPMPVDLRIIGFVFAVSFLTGVIFGTVPALIASRTDLNESMKASGRGATADRSRHAILQGLVVVELALALALLAACGFFVRGIYKVSHVDLGWHADNVLVGYMELDHDHYGEGGDPRLLAFGDRLVSTLRALPGVEVAGLSVYSPARGFEKEAFSIEGRPFPEQGKETYAGGNATGPGFFKTYGIKLVEGRDFTDADRPGSPLVAIVNESMAKKYWPGQSALGKRIGTGDATSPKWAEIVGVMADFRGEADFLYPAETDMKFMRPWAQSNARFIGFNVRTSSDPQAAKLMIRKAIGLLLPETALTGLETVKEMADQNILFYTSLRRILLEISALGLLLAAVGVYGVVANLTSERTREIGIRMALGAQAGSVVWIFVRRGLILALTGASVGLVASYFVLIFIARTLPQIPGNDLPMAAGIAIVLVAIALSACWLPAWRASKIDPITALRVE
jgi:predicted permease